MEGIVSARDSVSKGGGRSTAEGEAGGRRQLAREPHYPPAAFPPEKVSPVPVTLPRIYMSPLAGARILM